MTADPWAHEWPAPAKLNLFLHVVGRRADGYHLLQTVFRLVDCCDTLRFFRRADGAVRLAAPLPGIPEDSDLTVRAARLLQAATGSREGATISIEKRIPVGGGLGGGSSDAATTLLALDHLWGTGLGRAGLAPLALQLGADVPFFLLGRNAFAEGVGEVLTPVELPPAWYVIVTPPTAVPTAEIFAAPELTRSTKGVKIADFSASFDATGVIGCAFGRNDLEPVTCRRYPQVGVALEWLRRHGGLRHPGDARLSGSGASVFAPFGTEAEARSVASRIPAGWGGIAVAGLARHPLAL